MGITAFSCHVCAPCVYHWDMENGILLWTEDIDMGKAILLAKEKEN
jgi:hypothetical protein